MWMRSEFGLWLTLGNQSTMKPIQRSFAGAGAGVAATKAYIFTTHDDTEKYGAQWDVAYQTGIF